MLIPMLRGFFKGGELEETDIIFSLDVDSELQCSNECLGQTGCISFNYKSGTSGQENCQLSNKTLDEITEALKDYGEWVFYQDLETVSFISFN